MSVSSGPALQPRRVGTLLVPFGTEILVDGSTGSQHGGVHLEGGCGEAYVFEDGV